MMEQEIVDEIIDVLSDRSGFDDWWKNIDVDNQNEIKEMLVNVVKTKIS